MTKRTILLDTARDLGLPAREVVDVDDTPAGRVVTVASGVQYVIVPDDQPDADGKTGVMYLAAPTDRYAGSFPVYAQPGADDTPDGDAEAGDEYPAAGSIAAVLAWVAGDQERAEHARADETAREKPRARLVAELDALLTQHAAQPDADDTPDAETAEESDRG
jgi:hypothetical protein